jgi:dolichol kinase
MLTAISIVIFPFFLNFEFGKQFQLQRRILHLATGLLFVYLNETFDSKDFKNSLLVLSLGSVVIEFARRKNPQAKRIFDFFFGNLLRTDEFNAVRVPGAFYFLFGGWFTLELFQKDTASLAFLALGFGDPFAGLVGESVKKWWNFQIINGKSFCGFLGCFIAAGLATSFWLNDFHAFFRYGFLAATAELFSFLVDDNISFPLLFSWLVTITGGIRIPH